MKKGGVVFTLMVISLLLISVSFVSAGLFENVWSKITGRTTENITNGTETSPVEEEICGDGICQEDEVCDRDCCEAFCTLYCPEGAVEGSCGCECIEFDEPDKECEDGDVKYYICDDGTHIPECECVNEGWVCEMSARENCPADEPVICAGEIKITFNKGSYKLGDEVRIMIEVFDAGENRLPNYAFYAMMYDDRWHTPGLEQTDNEGYFIHTMVAEKPGGGVTKIRFKVYTKETSSCGSVEDTTEIGFEYGECGMGECEPKKECEDKIRMCGGECASCPEEDKDDEIFYSCNGCELEDKCYPYGYRKDGGYCLDTNNAFANQFGDNEVCENNFECQTNLCINGGCVSSNVWNRFLEWFKKLFGGDDEEKPTECSKLLIEKDIGDNEYIQSGYGEDEHTQVPVHLEDGTNVGTIKCCAAEYSTGMVMVCEFDKKEDVRNSLRWILARGIDEGPFSLEEYKGERVLNIGEGGILAWTKNVYLIASGGKPGAGNKFVEGLVDAYFKKYKSDFDITEDEIPYIEPEPEPIPCEEITDSEEQAGCYIDLAIANSDVKICEKIVYDSNHKNKCYIHVAEHTGDSDICENVDDSDLREKCYFWVAEQTENEDICVEISDSDLQEICYVNVAEQTWDASICENVIEIRIRNKCYREVAISTNNRSICELIIDDTSTPLNPKDECYERTD